MGVKPSFWLFLMACAALASTPPLLADMSGSAGAVAIPDNLAAGVNSQILFSQNEIISNLSVTINFGTINNTNRGHTYIGDLVATLTGPGGSITLFDRVGVPQTTFGDSSNLAGVYTWADGGRSLLIAASGVGNNQIVPNGTYSAADANDNFLSFASVFSGTTTAGTWTLNLSDRAASDVGGIVSWTLNIISTPIPVPEPSGFFASLIGLGAGWRVARRERLRERRRAKGVYYG